MASAIVHAVGLLKIHVPGLDSELLHEDYRCESDAAWDALVNGVYDAA
jgi:hypothetical protein